jgi:hypothetical protein
LVDSRIDPPHVTGASAPHTAEDGPATNETVGEESSADALELVRAQVQQLAGHLRCQQHDLDRREALLNVRLAQIDNFDRSERLWYNERREELSEREQELHNGQAELQERRAQLTAAEAFQDGSRREQELRFGQLDQQLQNRQSQLDAVAQRLSQQKIAQQQATERFRAARRRADSDQRRDRQQIDVRRQASLELVCQLLRGVERRRAAVEARDAELCDRERLLTTGWQQRTAELDQVAASQQVRQQRLADAEAVLTHDQQELHALRRQFDVEREEFEVRRGQQQREIDALRQAAELQLTEQQAALRRRGEQLDQRRAALDQMQADVRRAQREALETRLATEELLAQVAGSIPPATITSSISRLRGKLADHFRLATTDLAEQKQELEQLRGQLVEQHERLSRQKGEVQSWVRSRQEELEQQAAQLVGREQELDWQEEQIAHLKLRWQDERLGYQQEIRRLLGELSREEVAV